MNPVRRLTVHPPPSSQSPFDATVVITTKDRRDSLRATLRSALEQAGRVEVLVIDDGSSDDTSSMVRDEFPAARVVRFEESAGLIGRRNDAASLASGPIVVSIDDDAVFTSRDTVQRVVEEFDHPRIAVVAMPYIDVGRGETQVKQLAPDRDGRYITDPFIGTAHALRQDVFSALGGYRRELIRQGEEPDLCLRMLAAGYVTRLGSTAPIHHDESPRRTMSHVVFYMCRNDVMYAWHNVPMPYLPIRLVKIFAWSLGPMNLRHREPLAVARGLLAGLGYALRHRHERRPVSRAVYRLSHEIRNRGVLPLEGVDARLEAIAPGSEADAQVPVAPI
jgi:glycosyltransferase involved in cell wall biosynthesis